MFLFKTASKEAARERRYQELKKKAKPTRGSDIEETEREIIGFNNFKNETLLEAAVITPNNLKNET